MRWSNYKIFVVVFSLINLDIPLKALPEGPFTSDTILSQNIKTVQLFKKGWEFSYPFLELSNKKGLLLCFDDLDDKSKSYSYTILHCDAGWMPTHISSSEYMEGFQQNPVTSFEPSQSTNIPYFHYSIKIPNERFSLKISGNYVVIVYEDNNEDNPVLIKRFVVTEQTVQLFATIRRPTVETYQNTGQEVDFKIVHPGYELDNPEQTLKIVVVKNNNWRAAVSGFKPVSMNENEISYENDEKNIFLGGNEFRSFDCKDLKYQPANIQSINFINNDFQIVLKPDKPRNRTGYFYNEDLNGKYLVQNKQGTTPNTDAEYVHVHLSLSLYDPPDDGDIYVNGGFSDFTCYKENRMNYDADQKLYVADLLVKQGYYNYQYVWMPKNSNKADESYFEGSYFETENDYAIYVYYSPYGSLYDHLIAVKVINTLKP